jgi:hypothetical protein
MQALRTVARRIADSLYLLRLLGVTKIDYRRRLVATTASYAYSCKHCGYFARSFAADVHWRDRGHASGDDVALLEDVKGIC